MRPNWLRELWWLDKWNHFKAKLADSLYYWITNRRVGQLTRLATQEGWAVGFRKGQLYERERVC